MPQPKAPIWFAADWTVADARAIQDLMLGKADADQQKRVLDLIIKSLAMTYDVTFHPDNDRASAFMEGRRFVGLKLVELTKVDIAKLTKKESV